jgi:hypothetical protein
MFRDKDGNRMFRAVEITIRFPENTLPPERIRQKAEPKKGYNPDNLDEMLMKVADMLDVRFPWWEFKMISLTPRHRTACYVFSCVGFRANYQPPSDIATPDVVYVKPEEERPSAAPIV